jgi:hypothetical protein
MIKVQVSSSAALGILKQQVACPLHSVGINSASHDSGVLLFT